MDAAAVVGALHRDVWGRAVAVVARSFRDLELAEDAVQDAYADALRRWPEAGVPDNPAAWIVTAARNRALDRARRDQRFARRLPLLEAAASAGADPAAGVLDAAAGMDDQLAMLFACCHPALAPDARVALTLRLVGGLTTEEIARAFLVAPTTMAQRLVRAKRRVREAGIPLSVPPPEGAADRFPGVAAVIWSIFTEGYAAATGPALVRRDLAEEGIRLARLLQQLLPDEPEAAGLLALLLFQHSRRDARVDGAGSLVLLPDQDRRRWDHAAIAEAADVLDGALARRAVGPYQLQAAIARLHATAPTADRTDWRAIVGLYDLLLDQTGSRVVALNRAVAVAMAESPLAGLALLDELGAGGRLARSHLLPATRADLLRRLGRWEEAAHGYRAALALVANPVERTFLSARLEEVEAPVTQAG